MSKPFKGLPSITDMSNEDYQVWAEENKDKIKGKTSYQIDRLYKNQKFVEKYGVDTFNSLNKYERDSLYESDNINSYIQDNYSKDKRFNEIQGLTPEGKRELINSSYKNPEELNNAIQHEEDIYNNSFNNPFTDINSGISSVALAKKNRDTNIDFLQQNQEKSLNNIIEKDKDRKLSAVSELDRAIRMDYHSKLDSGELTLGDIYDEFDKIGSGYAETNTINGEAYWQEIPGSNYYNVFKDTKWLNNLSKEDKIDIISKYKSLANTYGLQDALYYLDTTIKEKVAEEQNGWEATKDVASRVLYTGFIPGLWQGALSLYAMTLSDEKKALFLEGKDENGNPIDGWGNIKYISDVQKYNTYDKDLIDEANENGGISQENTVWTTEQDNAWLSNKTYADVAEQSKWMIEMVVMSALTGGVGSTLAKAGSAIGKIGKIASATGKVATAIDKTTNAVKGIGNLTKVLVDVAPIAAAEAYEPYNSVYENAISTINSEIDRRAQEKAYDELSGKLGELNKTLALQNIENIMQEDIKAFKRQYPDVDNINKEYFREQAALKYLNYLTDQHRTEISPEYDGERKVASDMAVDAFKTTFTLSTLKSAISNIGFRRFLYDASFRQAFKGNVPKIKTQINNKGLAEQIPMTARQKYIEPIYRNTLGEAIDEGLDGIISGFSEGYGTGKFQHYWDTRNATGSFDRWLGGILSGFSAVRDKLTDESLYKEMLIGGIGGVTNISPSRNLFKIEKTPPINGKSYTFLEKFNNIISNPIINDILENKQLEAETAQRVENINKILNTFSDSYSDISKIMTSLGAHDKAIMTGTPEEILSTRQEAAIDLMMSLETLSNDKMSSSSTIIETTKKSIEEAANGNITDADINEFLSQPTNKDLRGKISTEDIKARIQENAKKLLSIGEQLTSTRKSLEKYPGFKKQPKEVQDFLIKNSIAIEGFKERIDSITKELELTPTTSYTPVIGSSKHLADRKRAIGEALREVDEKIVETEELTKEDFKEALEANNSNKVFSKRSKKLALKELKKSKKKLKRELDALNSTQINEDGHFRTLSAEEILALNPISLAEVFNKDNEKYYSNDQKTEINKAREILNERVKNSSLDLTLPMGYEDYAEYYTKTLSSLNTNVEIGTRSLDMFLEEGFNAEPVESLWKRGIGDSKRFLNKASMFNSWDELLFTTDGKLIDDIENSKLDTFIFNPFTGALEDYIDNLSDNHRNYKGNAINTLKVALIKSRTWNKVGNGISRNDSENKPQELSFLYSLIKNNDFNNSNDFIEILQDIVDSEDVSQTHKEQAKKFISIITGVEKLDDSTIVSDTPIEEKKEDSTTEKTELEPTAETLTGLEDLENSDDSTEISEDTTVEQEEVKEDISSPILESPILDSNLPTDGNVSTVDRGEIQGNRVYKYDGESLREDKKQVVRTSEKEGDIHDLINKWLSNRGIKLQEIIDNELANIAKLNPKVFFVMPNTTEFDSEGNPVYNKDTNPFLNAIFQVIEYTDEIKKLHNEEYGKPIIIGNKSYLVIGVSGYNSNNEAEEAAYNKIADSNKRVRYTTTKRIKSEGERIPEFVINPTIYTEIKNIQAGWVVKQMVKDEEVKERPLTELIEDKERNPHGITLQNSKWLIQEKSKTVTVRVDKSDVVHSPSDVESNLGSVFLLVPAANGHLIPITFKVKMLKDLSIDSPLRTTITEEILKLTRMDTRGEGLSNLLDLLLLSKDGDSLFFDEDALEDNILTVKKKGITVREIDLSANDVNTQLEELFFGETSTFKLNINVRVLSDPTQLRIYSESGALYTDVALLGTSNASYTVRALDEDYKPIQDPESTVNSSSSGFKGDYTNSQSKVMTYLGRRYTEREGEFYDSNGNLVTQQSRKQELLYAKWVEETNPTPSHGNASVKVYIKNSDKSNPIVIRQYSSGKISVLSKENALREIIKQEEKIAKQKREEEAKKALERENQSSNATEAEMDNIEGSSSIDNLFAEIESNLPKNKDTTETIEDSETSTSTTDNSVLSEGVPIENISSTSDVVTYLFSGQAEGDSVQELEDFLIDKGLETEEDVRKYLDKNNISIVGIKPEDVKSLCEILKHCKK